MENERRPPKRSNLKKMLNERRMSQKNLAKLSDLEEYQISNYVTGKFDDMLLSTSVKICEALDCTVDEAFGDKVREMKSDLRSQQGS